MTCLSNYNGQGAIHGCDGEASPPDGGRLHRERVVSTSSYRLC
jgi:hypothetical protein